MPHRALRGHAGRQTRGLGPVLGVPGETERVADGLHSDHFAI